MLKITIDEDFKNENKDTIPKEEKKKKISVLEIKDFLRNKGKVRHSVEQTKNRESGESDRRESKPYSLKCSLKNPSLVPLPIRSDTSLMRSLKPKCHPEQECGIQDGMNLKGVSQELLSEFEALAFAEILKEAVYSLGVLKRTLWEKDQEEVQEKPERIIVRKQGCCDKERVMYFGPDAGYTPVVPTIKDKLYENRDMVCNVLSAVACELQTKGTYDWLKCEINSIIDNRERKCNLTENLKIWTDLVEKLKDSYNKFEEDFKAQKKIYLEEIEKMSQMIDASYCVNTDKLEYTKRWEASKLEQQNLRQDFEEKALLNEIEELQKLRKVEAKVNKELSDYLTHAINNAESDIFSWSSRYNDEMEKRQQNITDLEDKIELLVKDLQMKREIQAFRQITIDKFLAAEQAKKDEEEYWEVVHECATKLQALWKGYMVRQRLGKWGRVFEEARRRRSSILRRLAREKKRKGKK